MKYWQKTFLATLSLFLVALNGCAFLLFDTSWQSALASERERGFSEHGFISDHLKEDITAILSRSGPQDNAISSLYQSYSAYYYSQGTYIALQDSNGGRYTNVPGLSSAPVVPADGSASSKINTSNGIPYLYVSGRIGATGYSLVTAHSVSGLQTRTDTLASTLVIGSTCISALLALALFFILKGLTAPIRKLSAAASSLAEGDYAIRAGVRGRDELSDLAWRFNGMADKIQSQIHELTEEAEKKQRFIDDLAHEMRTPLTAIGGYAQYLMAAAATEDERLSALEYISRESRRLSELSEKLLMLTRLRGSAPVCERVEFSRLFGDLHAAVINQADERRVLLVLNDNHTVWRSDGTLLFMLLLNLVQNALRACSEGGKVTVTADMSCVEVRDDGCGMDEASLAHVTEPFYRVDKSRSRAGGGAGLGLSICQSICDSLGLSLTIQSMKGKGTSVNVLQVHDTFETAP